MVIQQPPTAYPRPFVSIATGSKPTASFIPQRYINSKPSAHRQLTAGCSGLTKDVRREPGRAKEYRRQPADIQ